MTRSIGNNKADVNKPLAGIKNSKNSIDEPKQCEIKISRFRQIIDEKNNDIKNLSDNNENGDKDIEILKISMYVKQLEKKLNKELLNLEKLNKS